LNFKRHGILAGTVLTAALALAACGTDNNTTPQSSGSPTVNSNCATGSLAAEGSTAQLNAMTQWIKDYTTACTGAKINYQGTGSGAGIQSFIKNTADFAGSDSPMKDPTEQQPANTRCGSGNTAIHLPMVIGPIAVVYNVAGVSNLQLSPSTLAKIFTGKITNWNDPAIAADNSGTTIPAGAIVSVHRADSSGTTDNFTKYLGAAAAADYTFPHDKVWKAPGGQAETKSDGVSAAVKSTPNSIGYVEWSFAQVNGLSTAKIKNGAGEWADLSADSAGKTIASAQQTGTGDDLQLKIDYNTTTSGAYPIVLVTYEIVCQKGTPADKLPLVKSFLNYAATTGQGTLANLGYAPLPSSVASKVVTAIGNLS
jgi:phosphate transport system substrate-binding protein